MNDLEMPSHMKADVILNLRRVKIRKKTFSAARNNKYKTIGLVGYEWGVELESKN